MNEDLNKNNTKHLNQLNQLMAKMETTSVGKVDPKIEEIQAVFKALSRRIEYLEVAQSNLEDIIKKLNLIIKGHIAEPTSEILVKEKDGSWGDFSGEFHYTQEEQKKSILDQARNHYDRFFKDRFPEKTFAIQLNYDGKKELNEIKNKKAI